MQISNKYEIRWSNADAAVKRLKEANDKKELLKQEHERCKREKLEQSEREILKNKEQALNQYIILQHNKVKAEQTRAKKLESGRLDWLNKLEKNMKNLKVADSNQK